MENTTGATATTVGFCAQTANLWQIAGYVLLVFKIVIPLLLIIFGMIDLGKAVIASKEDEIKKATSSLVRRAIAAVIIFLLPTIITFMMSIISDFDKNSDVKDDFAVCRACISNPTDTSSCDADAAWKGTVGQSKSK